MSAARISEVMGTRVLPFDPPKDLAFQRKGRETSFGTYFVSFALPGNVVTRFGITGDYEWIPPKISGRSIQLLPDYMQLKPQRLAKIAQLPTIPSAFYSLMGIAGEARFNKLIEINPQEFASGSAHEGRWFYCVNCNDVYHLNSLSAHTGHDTRTLRVETRSYPIEYSSFNAEGPNPTPVKPPPVLNGVIDDLLFYDRYDHRIAIQGGVLGAHVSLKFRDGNSLDLPLMFVSNNEPAIISTERINTDGFLVRIKDHVASLLDIETDLELKESAFSTNLAFDLQFRLGIGRFDAEAMASLFLTSVSVKGDLSEGDVEKLQVGTPVSDTLISRIAKGGGGDFNSIFNLVLNEIYLPDNPHLSQLITDLIRREDVRLTIRNAVKKYHDKKSVAEFARVSFIHSLAHAMVNASNVVGGNEFADEYYRDFSIDKTDGQFAICESEPSTGGIRLIQRNYWETPLTRGVARSSARDFSFILEDYVFDCPVRDTEFFVETLLYRGSPDFVKGFLDSVKQSRTTTQLRSRLTKVSGQSPPVHPVFVDKIRQVVEDFDLYLETYMLYEYLKKRLGRYPTQLEFAWFISVFPPLIQQYQTEFVGELSTAMNSDTISRHSSLPRIFSMLAELQNDTDLLREQILKRIPHTCTFSCPACLGVECNFLEGLLARVLNQELLRRVIVRSISKWAVWVTPAVGKEESLAHEVSSLLSKGNRAYLVLDPSEQAVLTGVRRRLLGETVNENRIYDCDSRVVRAGDHYILLSQFGVVRKP